MSENSEEERRNYEYLIEKKNRGKKLSKNQKKDLKRLSEKYSKQYDVPKKTKEETDRANERAQQRKFNNADINGKIMIIIGSFIKALSSYIREIIIYLSALSSIFYLYYKFDNKKSSDYFPNDSTKFPYVYVEKNKDYDEQYNLTTKTILNDAKLSDNIFIKTEAETSANNGSMDYEKMREKINQPENARKSNMDPFASFFNYTSNDIKSYEVNLLQIVSYMLVSGIIGINTAFAKVHDVLENIYKMSDLGPENPSFNIKNIFGFLFTIFISVILFFLFRLSKNDLSQFLSPFIDQSILNSKIKNIFGLEDLLDLFSSLFSGFFAGFKLLFVASFIAFIFASTISLYKLSSNVTNLSSVFIILTVALSFFSSLILFIISMIQAVKNENQFSINEIFYSILGTVEKYLQIFKEFIKSNSLISSMLNLDKINSGNPFTMIIFVLSLILTIPFIPIMVLILSIIILFIIFSFIPFVASFYMGIKTTFDVTIKGIFNMPSFFRKLTESYIPIAISFVLCFFIILNKIDSGNIVKLIESILNTILFVLTIIFILLFGKYNQLRFKEKDEIVKQEIDAMTETKQAEITKNDNTNTTKTQKLKKYIKKSMKEKIIYLLSEKSMGLISESLKSISGPAISFLIMGLFYIVNHIKTYKNKISNIPIKNISLMGSRSSRRNADRASELAMDEINRGSRVARDGANRGSRLARDGANRGSRVTDEVI